MPKFIKVYLKPLDGERTIVDAEVIKELETTFIVRLPDGNKISRKKSRDVVLDGQTS